MTLFEDTNPRDLKELLTQIHTRESALPNFQRDFVWEPRETADLVVSIANNYPAGTLLRIRNSRRLFDCREFAGAPALGDHLPTYLVLDGQQRLTSLYQAFYGVGDHVYFLDLHVLLAGADFEEALDYERATSRRGKRLQDREVQTDTLVLPLAALANGSSGFNKWAMETVQARKGEEDPMKLLADLNALNEQWIQRIDDYRFPVVTLAESTQADAVCTIFETLNRTGVKLSVFELLTARFWPEDINLRTLWQEACENQPILKDFEVDPYYLLQAIALIGRDTPACTRSHVLKLKGDDVREWWEPVVNGMANGLKLLRDDCGVIVPRWLPYYPMLISLAAILARFPKSGTPEAGAQRSKLTRWFWCSVFGQTYEKSSNSQAAKDVLELSNWLRIDAVPAGIEQFTFDAEVLNETTPKQRGLYNGAMCAILQGRPRDFHTLQPITGDLIVENRIDDHHVFPSAFLGDTLISRRRDAIVNRTLIDRSTNQRISARAPSDYMTEMREALGEARFTELLESHGLPTGSDSPFWTDDVDGFLRWRCQGLAETIRTLTGGHVEVGL